METIEYIQDGFVFYSQKESEMAAEEKKKIEYLESRIDYARPEMVLRIYEKALQERVFHTPVGIHYLRRLQEYLQKQPQIEKEKLPPVPAYAVPTDELRPKTSPARNRIQPVQEKKEKFPALRVSVLFNVVMTIAVIAMFVIALNASNPNILNYEKALTNKYAEWEKDLTQREQKVREKEKELRLHTEVTEIP